MSDFRASAKIAALRAKVAALESGGRPEVGVLPFGDEALDGRLPGGGLGLQPRAHDFMPTAQGQAAAG